MRQFRQSDWMKCALTFGKDCSHTNYYIQPTRNMRHSDSGTSQVFRVSQKCDIAYFFMAFFNQKLLNFGSFNVVFLWLWELLKWYRNT